MTESKVLSDKQFYMVLYNYQDKDYSIVIAVDSCEKAIKYIEHQENSLFYGKSIKFKPVQINNQSELLNNNDDRYINICIANSNLYHHLNLIDIENYSQYIIVPMNIE